MKNEELSASPWLRLSNILPLIKQVPRTCKIRQIRAIRVRKIIFAYIKLNTNLPRIHTGSQPKRFVRFVRFVFEKKTFAYVKLTTNLPNQTNHVNADRIKKRIRLQSPLSCQGTIKRKSKNKSVKRLRNKSDTPWVFFDSSSVAAGSQSAMQQYYLHTIYIMVRYRDQGSLGRQQASLVEMLTARRWCRVSIHVNDYVIFP